MNINIFEQSLLEMGIDKNIIYNDGYYKKNKSNQKVLEQKYNQFEIYREYLVQKNKLINLTNIIEKDDIYKKHFLDSLSVFLCSKFKDGDEIIDIGTGAGFPAIPMKIMMTTLNITLMDSLKKRVDFLEEVGYRLDLDMNYIHGRAEDYGRKDEFREKFDVAVSRAVANFSTLLEYTLPFVKVGGFFIALKGRAYREEVDMAENALNILGGKIDDIINVNIPCSNLEHKLIIVKKTSNTISRYPRKAGIPQKNPL